MTTPVAKSIAFVCVCGTSPADWEKVRTICNKHSSFAYPQFGLHPWWIKEYLENKRVLKNYDI